VIQLRPALCSVTFRALAPPAIAELAASAGLAAVEWGADAHVRPGELAAARTVRSLTEANGLRVASYGSYWRPDDASASAAVIETALALGAPNIRIWPGFAGQDSAGYSGEERRVVTDRIRAMADAASSAGISLSLEYHPKTLTDGLDSARILLAEVDHSGLFIYWQPRPGLPIDVACTEVVALALDLSHLHVFEWDAAGTRYPLARGLAYWRDVFAAVRTGRWGGERYAMIEFVAGDEVEQFRTDAGELVRLLGALNPSASRP
jgi:sugar phosphate isomerase/epimerase